MSEKREKILKGVSEIKGQASKLGKDAAKTVGTIKQALQTSIEGSKAAFEKASEVVNKDRLKQGLNVTSKGMEMFAKGARMASKGAEAVADSVEKASKQIKKAGKPKNS